MKKPHEILRDSTHSFPGGLESVEEATGITAARVYKWQCYEEDRFRSFDDPVRLVSFLARHGFPQILSDLCRRAGGSFMPHRPSPSAPVSILGCLSLNLNQLATTQGHVLEALSDGHLTPDELSTCEADIDAALEALTALRHALRSNPTVGGSQRG